MCGIVGQVRFDGEPVEEALLRRMGGLLVHRGPDDEGFYVDGPLGLGMRRLSIIDVAGGHQPLANEDGSVWIVCNGEIYNCPELRRELEQKGHRFATRTDVEVIVHLFEEMGERCVARLNGMFAFAIWDARRRRLVLARDRLGKKPLHYAVTHNALTFASEIPPILDDPAIERNVDLLALQQYLRLWYVPGPRTMFEGIRKLPPAHILVCEGGLVRLERYWDLDFSRKLNLSEAEWSERVLELLQDAVRIRLVSDVPLGALLSGGVDSSTVVALMSRLCSQPVKTFSIGFEEEGYNELPYARQVAQHLGTEHHEEIVRPDAAEVLPKLVWHYGEPFGDESSIPTYYVSRLARQHVTVALSGDGGDESFGGYPRLAEYLAFSAARSLRGLAADQVKGILSADRSLVAALDPRRWLAFGRELGFRAREIIDPMERYAHAWTVWQGGLASVLTPEVRAAARDLRALAPLARAWRRTRGWEAMDRLFYLELMTYLPDDLQVKMDIASMAASLEVRAPFLDYRLVELAASMPARLKIDEGQTKVLLRRIVDPLLPPDICRRGKWGFSMPIGRWLAGDLRPMMEDLLLDGTCRGRGFFRPDAVRDLVEAHVAGRRDWGRQLWLLLNFELWLRTFVDKPAAVIARTAFPMRAGAVR